VINRMNVNSFSFMMDNKKLIVEFSEKLDVKCVYSILIDQLKRFECRAYKPNSFLSFSQNKTRMITPN
jgi:hypothetical protein